MLLQQVFYHVNDAISLTPMTYTQSKGMDAGVCISIRTEIFHVYEM